MSSTNSNEPVNSNVNVKQPDQVERLTEEIAHSGVADNAEDVERLANEGPQTGEVTDLDDDGTIPLPVITRT